MSNEAIQFDYELDQESQKNVYPCEGIDWTPIPDNNAKNYSNGLINFNNVNISGTNANIQHALSKTNVLIPYTYSLKITGGTFTSDGINIVEDNKYASSVKGYHNFIESHTSKMGSTSLNVPVDNTNIIMNEKLKRMGLDEKLLYGSKLNYELDSTNSYAFDAGVGESNNVVRPVALTNAKSNEVNNGHLRRMQAVNNTLNALDPYVLLSGEASIKSALQPKMSLNSPTELKFTGVASIPLAEIHDVYKQMPTMSSVRALELRLQTNLAVSNSWTIVYTGGSQAVSTEYKPKGLIAIQPYGSTCPFLVSNCGSAVAAGANRSSAFGLTVFPTAANTEFRVTVTGKIGYDDDTAQPCELMVPSYTMNPSYASSILSEKAFRLLYNDHSVTWIRGRTANSGIVTEKLQGSFQRPRKVFVIPFMSNVNQVTSIDGNVNMVVPYQSLISSAPVSCSPCPLSNFNIKIGQKPIYGQPLQYSHEFYDQHVLEALGKVNGNSSRNPFFSGLITKDMHQKNYPVYVFNIERVSNEQLDNEDKDIYLVCKQNSTKAIDFMVILERQCEVMLNRSTGLYALNNDIV